MVRSARAIPLLLVLACGEHPLPHPRGDSLARPIPPALTVDLGVPGGDELPIHPLGADGSSLVVIGTLGGSSRTVLGRIAGVARVGEQIGVLDAQTMTLRVFGLDGRPLYTLGTRGQGPGEFMSPRSVQASDGKAFVVFDATGRVTRFDAREGAPPQTLMRFDGLLEGGCMLGDDIYIHGLRAGDDRVIHRYDSRGHYVGSFGEMYRTKSRVVLMHVALGHIACIPERELVVVLPALLPELRAYAMDGTFLWWDTVECEGGPPMCGERPCEE